MLRKYRSMTDERDAEGNLLPDGARLTRFGKWLRATSMDELPEAINILKGDMSVIGPRPQLVRDMVFMTPEQRMRHALTLLRSVSASRSLNTYVGDTGTDIRDIISTCSYHTSRNHDSRYSTANQYRIFVDIRYDDPLTVVGHIELEAPTWFAGDGKTTEKLRYGVWQTLPEKGIICIDTGCGKGGTLTAMMVENGKYRLDFVPGQ